MSEHEHLINPDRFADSAGVSWSGRHFEANSWAGDDGTADQKLIQTITLLRQGRANTADVLNAMRGTRVLVPLLANLGEVEIGANGLAVDKSAELSIVTVQTPDGQSGLPVFTSVAAMSKWNPQARPVPVGAEKAALAAASEKNTRLIFDASNETEYVVRRPAIAALAQGLEWTHPLDRAEIHDAFAAAVQIDDQLVGFELVNSDPHNLLESAEVELVLKLVAGLERETIEQILQALAQRLSQSFEIAEYVDSLRVKIASV